MLSESRGDLQRAMITGIQNADPSERPTQEDIAEVIGCHPSDISRFKKGERSIDLNEIVSAAERWGPDAVIGPLAAKFGRRLVGDPLEPVRARDLPRAVARVTRIAADAGDVLHEALADGLFTDEEAEDLSRRFEQLAAEARRLALRKVRAGRAA